MKKVKDEGKFNKVKFHPGEIRTSAGIAKLHSKKYFFYFSAVSFRRYVSGDWGNLSEEEKKQNDKALLEGKNFYGKFAKEGEPSICFFTEQDKKRTTICLLEEMLEDASGKIISYRYKECCLCEKIMKVGDSAVVPRPDVHDQKGNPRYLCVECAKIYCFLSYIILRFAETLPVGKPASISKLFEFAEREALDFEIKKEDVEKETGRKVSAYFMRETNYFGKKIFTKEKQREILSDKNKLINYLEKIAIFFGETKNKKDVGINENPHISLDNIK